MKDPKKQLSDCRLNLWTETKDRRVRCYAGSLGGGRREAEAGGQGGGGGRGRGGLSMKAGGWFVLIIGLGIGVGGRLDGRRLRWSLDFSESIAQTGVTSVSSLASVWAVRIFRVSARSGLAAVNDDAGEARKMERRIKETIVSAAGIAAIEW